MQSFIRNSNKYSYHIKSRHKKKHTKHKKNEQKKEFSASDVAVFFSSLGIKISHQRNVR